MSGQIFISYRRDESRWSARSLCDRLAARFDRSQIFMDIDTIGLGEDFVKTIEETVGSCDVLIAVIGAHWLTSTDGQGGRRLDNPEDFVRMEIATALRRNIRVIPVLVDGALMPQSNDLPDDLKPLVRRNALQVGDTHFDDDCRRLVAAIEQVLEKNTAKRREREEKERLDHEPQLQLRRPVAPFAPSTPPAKPEADKLSVEAPKVVSPLPPRSLSKQLIALFAVAAVLAVGGLIYLAIRPSQSPPAQPAPFAATTPTPVIATPLVEEKAPTTPEVAVEPSAKPITASAQEQALKSLTDATKEHPWVNRLGMKFVPVAGTQVLFSIWDTRVEDFRAFVDSAGYDAIGGMWSLGVNGLQDTLGATWKEPGFKQGSTDPVVGVTWGDATAFCEWLTKRERGSGALPEGRHYRLPTDEEWSIAVGLDSETGNSPQEKSVKIEVYPWGKEWPPPPGVGNYAGEESRIGNEPKNWTMIEGYNDGYPRTSPVGSFAANKNGLYDMGGNVWQWCEDWYNWENKGRVVRGAAWSSGSPHFLFASFRGGGHPPKFRYADVGFRCVVAAESSR